MATANTTSKGRLVKARTTAKTVSERVEWTLHDGGQPHGSCGQCSAADAQNKAAAARKRFDDSVRSLNTIIADAIARGTLSPKDGGVAMSMVAAHWPAWHAMHCAC